MVARRRLGAEVFVLLAVLPAPVRADRGEWRLGVAASGIAATFKDSRSESSALVPGGLARLTFGLTNGLELGARLDLRYASTIEFRDANVDGDEGRLITSFFAPALAVDARWIAGVELSPRFWRTHPILGARLGVLGVRYGSRMVLDERQRLVDRYDSTFDLRPFAGVEAGVEHRFGRTLVGGVAMAADVARGYRALGLNVEMSWLWY